MSNSPTLAPKHRTRDILAENPDEICSDDMEDTRPVHVIYRDHRSNPEYSTCSSSFVDMRNRTNTAKHFRQSMPDGEYFDMKRRIDFANQSLQSKPDRECRYQRQRADTWHSADSKGERRPGSVHIRTHQFSPSQELIKQYLLKTHRSNHFIPTPMNKSELFVLEDQSCPQHDRYESDRMVRAVCAPCEEESHTTNDDDYVPFDGDKPSQHPHTKQNTKIDEVDLGMPVVQSICPDNAKNFTLPIRHADGLVHDTDIDIASGAMKSHENHNSGRKNIVGEAKENESAYDTRVQHGEGSKATENTTGGFVEDVQESSPTEKHTKSQSYSQFFWY